MISALEGARFGAELLGYVCDQNNGRFIPTSFFYRPEVFSELSEDCTCLTSNSN